MAWFTRNKPSLNPEEGGRRVRTEGLWLKCEHCGQIIWRKALEDNLQVCPKCDHHYRIDARTRLALLFDGGGFEEFDTRLTSTDPLHFVDSKTIWTGWPQCRNPRTFATPLFRRRESSERPPRLTFARWS